jgi:hypothetical protein
MVKNQLPSVAYIRYFITLWSVGKVLQFLFATEVISDLHAKLPRSI